MKKPNILFLLVDQLRPDHAGFMPEAVYSTPHLKALAESATVFTNCQSVNPICMPARSALLTGRYSHQIGAHAMAGDLNFDLPTFPRALQNAGYWTAMAGKLHVLQSWPWGTPRGRGTNLHALAPKIKTLGFNWLWESAGKQLAVKNYCDWCAHLDARGILEPVRDFLAACGDNRNVADEALEPDGKPWPFDEADHVDVVTGDKAIQALRERPKDTPFYLNVSFCSPHKPFDPPQRYLDAEPYEETDDYIPGPEGEELSPDLKKTLWRLRRAYRATIRLVDDQIGRILDELREQGELDNTVILFSSDHGEMMGDHGRVQKSTYYRESLTVPTLVRDPRQPAHRVYTPPVELTDLTATILDTAGLDPQTVLSEPWPAYRDRIPCRSLRPALTDDTPVREFAFSESSQNWHCMQSATRKYVRHILPDVDPGFHEEFFDLVNDPREQRNLAHFPDEREALQRHRHALEHLLATTPPAQHAWAAFG
ncbi:MAG: sulfatase-like hydrolase/transferase [Verrucomicrobia bacterium]|nr:sulfatase-like hydrolase/transferase [Verrucomicrobiota bacterium]MCH8527511.1 sulfatase-like hydrolase/transferase [Kiritimatiellia bacterium]